VLNAAAPLRRADDPDIGERGQVVSAVLTPRLHCGTSSARPVMILCMVSAAFTPRLHCGTQHVNVVAKQTIRIAV
jgi:hypothetical protein